MPHGGALAQMRSWFPHAPAPFIDLSTGINPIPYKIDPISADQITRLPEDFDVALLERVAARSFGVADADLVQAGPGTQIFISLLPRLIGLVSPRVAVLGPTYSEHALAWRYAEAQVTSVGRFGDLVDADIAVLCNPNNPDGRVVAVADLLALADAMAAKGGWLVVDEAFADLEEPGFSVAPMVGRPGLIVLRSFGKWSGLAGLRLGFVLGPIGFVMACDEALGPWAVSGPALAAGLQAIPDAAWRVEAGLRLRAEGARMDALFAQAGLGLVGGTRLFRLYEGGQAQAVWRRLAEAGILARRFDDMPNWLRLGLPAGEEEWSRLERSVAAAWS